MKRTGYFFLLGFRRRIDWCWGAIAILCLAAAMLLNTGCVSKAIYKDAAESGWKRWDSDHKPVVTDEAYNNMTEAERANVMPESKFNAREFEKREALNLLKD